MSKQFNRSAIFAAAVLGIGFSLSSAAPAKADSLLTKCNGSSKAMVESCCAAWVRRNGQTYWMIESGATCGSAAVCGPSKRGNQLRANIGYAAPKKPGCFLEIPPATGGGTTTIAVKARPTFAGKP